MNIIQQSGSRITVTDEFCGAGGASTGAVDAGLDVVMALNHWDLAIRTHNTNHPDTDHDCRDISASDPMRYPRTTILWASPECTNHSLAKGKRRKHNGTGDLFKKAPPKDEDVRSRATMWDVPRFAEVHQYQIVIVENVVDARRWVMWDAWIHAMKCLGYEHETVYFNSMFAPPTPQSRDRMYVVFWRKGNRKPDLDIRPEAYCPACVKDVGAVQSWKNPEKRWGKYGKNGQYVYRCPDCAREIVPYYYAAFNCIDWNQPATRIGDRKKPLKPKTMDRIRYGIERYSREPLIISMRYTSGIGCRSKPAMQTALGTQPGDKTFAIANPGLLQSHNGGMHPAKGAADPMGSVTTIDSKVLLSPALIRSDYFSDPGVRHAAIEPAATQTTNTRYGIAAAPMLVRTDYRARPGVRPASGAHPTQTADAKLGVLSPALIQLGHSHAGIRRSRSAASAMPAQTTRQTVGVAAPPFIAELHGRSRAKGLESPLLCVTGGGTNHALIAPEAFLTYYYGTAQASALDEAVRTMTSVQRAGLVQGANGIPINDYTFRMLMAHEIQRAMAFLDTYVVLGTKRQKVKQLGNAVTPPVAKILFKRCAASLA